jgi:hypothetical protein
MLKFNFKINNIFWILSLFILLGLYDDCQAVHQDKLDAVHYTNLAQQEKEKYKSALLDYEKATTDSDRASALTRARNARQAIIGYKNIVEGKVADSDNHLDDAESQEFIKGGSARDNRKTKECLTAIDGYLTEVNATYDATNDSLIITDAAISAVNTWTFTPIT